MEKMKKMKKVLLVALYALAVVVRVESWSDGRFFVVYDDGKREQVSEERFNQELRKMIDNSDIFEVK